MLDSLIRVDIMCMPNGDVVVNEFEGFEAAVDGTFEQNRYVERFGVNFWKSKIVDILEKLSM